MIDENKIKEAAKSLRKDFDDDVTQGFLVEFGFEKGAKWAINELSKDLVHPASENAKIALLKEVAIEYSGKTIDNVIKQLEAIRKDVSND